MVHCWGAGISYCDHDLARAGASPHPALSVTLAVLQTVLVLVAAAPSRTAMDATASPVCLWCSTYAVLSCAQTDPPLSLASAQEYFGDFGLSRYAHPLCSPLLLLTPSHPRPLSPPPHPFFPSRLPPGFSPLSPPPAYLLFDGLRATLCGWEPNLGCPVRCLHFRFEGNL